MIAAGLVTSEGEVLAQEVIPTHQAGPGRALENLWFLLDRMVGEAKRQGLVLVAIGVGVPGSVETSAGTIGLDIPNVPELAGCALASLLKERYGIDAFIDNDVNNLALDAYLFGVGRGTRSFVVLAVGTGVGGGVILDGELLRGASGYGGELGHMTINFDGRPCFCGSRGCLKTYISGPDIVAQAVERLPRYPSSLLSQSDPHALTPRHLFEAERSGDPLAVELVGDVCQALGAGLAVIVNSLNPERLLLTGGVAESLQGHLPRILEWVRQYAFAGALAGTEICCTPSEKQSTVRCGAALVVYETSIDLRKIG